MWTRSLVTKCSNIFNLKDNLGVHYLEKFKMQLRRTNSNKQPSSAIYNVKKPCKNESALFYDFRLDAGL